MYTAEALFSQSGPAATCDTMPTRGRLFRTSVTSSPLVTRGAASELWYWQAQQQYLISQETGTQRCHCWWRCLHSGSVSACGMPRCCSCQRRCAGRRVESPEKTWKPRRALDTWETAQYGCGQQQGGCAPAKGVMQHRELGGRRRAELAVAVAG